MKGGLKCIFLMKEEEKGFRGREPDIYTVGGWALHASRVALNDAETGTDFCDDV